MLIANKRILLSVKNDHRIVKSLVVIFDPINRVKQGFSHFCRQKWNHEPILKDVVHIFIVFRQRSRVYHRVYDQVL